MTEDIIQETEIETEDEGIFEELEQYEDEEIPEEQPAFDKDEMITEE